MSGSPIQLHAATPGSFPLAHFHVQRVIRACGVALGIVGLVSYTMHPSKGAASGVVRGVYGIFNYRPVVKPFDKRAREIYDQDEYSEGPKAS